MSVAFTANNTFYITGSFTEIFKGAAISFASSAIFSGIGAAGFGDNFWGRIGRSLAHGVAGGVLAELQGGEFRHGFVSVAATKLMDVNGMFEGMGMESADYAGLRVLTAALIGGAISEHTGGKFANGAATAAIAQIYNGEDQLAERRAQKGEDAYKDRWMKLGEKLRGGAVRKQIEALSTDIEAAAAKYGVDGDLIRAHIYEEQTHLLPYEDSKLAQLAGKGNTVGLGQIAVGTYGLTRQQLLDPVININAMARHISYRIWDTHVIDHNLPYAAMADRYNCNLSCATSISNYGMRVHFYRQHFINNDW